MQQELAAAPGSACGHTEVERSADCARVTVLGKVEMDVDVAQRCERLGGALQVPGRNGLLVGTRVQNG